MEYKIIRSNRKTVELSINDELEAVVKAPLKMSKKDIDTFVLGHEKWIEKQKARKKENLEKFRISAEDEEKLRSEALPYLSERTEYYAKIIGVKPTGVKITSAKKRFGSCSGKNSICYSWRLMQYPPEAIDYVVVHELCHIIHRNHSAAFYRTVEKFLPDYKEREKLLK